MRSALPFFCLAFTVLVAVEPASAVRPPESLAGLEKPLAVEATPRAYETVPLGRAGPLRSAGLGEGWVARVDRRTGAVHAAWGGDLVLAAGIDGERDAARLARDFLVSRSELLRTTPERLVLRSVRHAAGKYAVWFRQEIDGVRVRGAEAFVLMTEAGRVAAFGSDFLDVDGPPPPAVLSAAEALTRATGSLATTARSDRPVETDRLLVRAPVGELLELVPAWQVSFESERPFGKWETIVDARTGEILARRNRIRFIDVVGAVQSSVERTGYCDGQVTLPAADLDVRVIGGGSAFTNAGGAFTVGHAGALPVLVSAELRGRWVDVDRGPGLGPDASWLGPATPGIPINVLFHDGNARADERVAWHCTNVAHRFLKDLDPTLTDLDYPVPASVGRVDFVCPGNAWWDGNGMGFCEQSTTFGNSGRMDTIVYHEYGHGVTEAVYFRNGTSLTSLALSEGNSDVYANFVAFTSLVGRGWLRDNCASVLRDSHNSYRYPDDLQGGSGHWDGQIIAGFHWDLWQSLRGSMPPEDADSVAWSTWHWARDLGTPQDLPDQVLWTFLADDDDGDLSTETPHYESICLGALLHGFECPEVVAQVTVDHARLSHVTDGSSPFDLLATVQSTIGTIDPASVIAYYRVNGGAFQAIPMAPTGNPDEYLAQIPPQPPMSEVEYYLTATDDRGRIGMSPELAPAYLNAFDVAWSYDDGETGAGWTMGIPGDDATAGQWGHFDPVGTLAQPEHDASPGAGLTMCFVTGQCASGHGSCYLSCTLGCNDVDDGTTTLLSPVLDLTGATEAVVKYDRWYSNDTAANPGEDFWVVDVSNDGGATWTNVENTSASEAAWRTCRVDVAALFGSPGRVQLRFVASDLGNPSLVEAAVDELRVLATFGGGPVAAASVAPAPAALALGQNRPNPFRPGTLIEYQLPTDSRVELAVYDVRGRRVRTLVSGARPAGMHGAPWDGRDVAGERVAPGVYFYRLTTESGSLTRKLTVAP